MIGTTTALSGLAPATNYSVQVAWDKIKIKLLLSNSWRMGRNLDEGVLFLPIKRSKTLTSLSAKRLILIIVYLQTYILKHSALVNLYYLW